MRRTVLWLLYQWILGIRTFTLPWMRKHDHGHGDAAEGDHADAHGKAHDHGDVHGGVTGTDHGAIHVAGHGDTHDHLAGSEHAHGPGIFSGHVGDAHARGAAMAKFGSDARGIQANGLPSSDAYAHGYGHYTGRGRWAGVPNVDPLAARYAANAEDHTHWGAAEYGFPARSAHVARLNKYGGGAGRYGYGYGHGRGSNDEHRLGAGSQGGGLRGAWGGRGGYGGGGWGRYGRHGGYGGYNGAGWDVLRGPRADGELRRLNRMAKEGDREAAMDLANVLGGGLEARAAAQGAANLAASDNLDSALAGGFAGGGNPEALLLEKARGMAMLPNDAAERDLRNRASAGDLEAKRILNDNVQLRNAARQAEGGNPAAMARLADLVTAMTDAKEARGVDPKTKGDYDMLRAMAGEAKGNAQMRAHGVVPPGGTPFSPGMGWNALGAGGLGMVKPAGYNEGEMAARDEKAAQKAGDLASNMATLAGAPAWEADRARINAVGRTAADAAGRRAELGNADPHAAAAEVGEAVDRAQRGEIEAQTAGQGAARNAALAGANTVQQHRAGEATAEAVRSRNRDVARTVGDMHQASRPQGIAGHPYPGIVDPAMATADHLAGEIADKITGVLTPPEIHPGLEFPVIPKRKRSMSGSEFLKEARKQEERAKRQKLRDEIKSTREKMIGPGGVTPLGPAVPPLTPAEQLKAAEEAEANEEAEREIKKARDIGVQNAMNLGENYPTAQAAGDAAATEARRRIMERRDRTTRKNLESLKGLLPKEAAKAEAAHRGVVHSREPPSPSDLVNVPDLHLKEAVEESKKSIEKAVLDTESEVPLKNASISLPMRRLPSARAETKEASYYKALEEANRTYLRNTFTHKKIPTGLPVFEMGNKLFFNVPESADSVVIEKGKVFYRAPEYMEMKKAGIDVSALQPVTTNGKADLEGEVEYYVAPVSDMTMNLPSVSKEEDPSQVLKNGKESLDISRAAKLTVDKGVLKMMPWGEYKKLVGPKVYSSGRPSVAGPTPEEQEEFKRKELKNQAIANTKVGLLEGVGGKPVAEVTPSFGVVSHDAPEALAEQLRRDHETEKHIPGSLASLDVSGGRKALKELDRFVQNTLSNVPQDYKGVLNPVNPMLEGGKLPLGNLGGIGPQCAIPRPGRDQPASLYNNMLNESHAISQKLGLAPGDFEGRLRRLNPSVFEDLIKYYTGLPNSPNAPANLLNLGGMSFSRPLQEIAPNRKLSEIYVILSPYLEKLTGVPNVAGSHPIMITPSNLPGRAPEVSPTPSVILQMKEPDVHKMFKLFKKVKSPKAV